jgi:hypothetical protein
MPYFLWHCPVQMSNKVKANPAKAKPIFFHYALIKLLIIEELKKRKKTWGYFLFWSEFTYEEDPENPLGNKKRFKKCKQHIAPDT